MVKCTSEDVIISFEPSFTSIDKPRKHRCCRLGATVWWSFMKRVRLHFNCWTPILEVILADGIKLVYLFGY